MLLIWKPSTRSVRMLPSSFLSLPKGGLAMTLSTLSAARVGSVASWRVTSNPWDSRLSARSGLSSFTSDFAGSAVISSMPLPAVGSRTVVVVSMPARRAARKAIGEGVL